AGAKIPLALGPRLDLDTDGSDVGIGLELRLDLAQLAPSVRLDLRPAFDWIFVGHDITFFMIGADPLFAFNVRPPTVEPYAIAGLGIFHASYSNCFGCETYTRVGLNLGGGARFLLDGKVQPFVELRASIRDGSFVLLTGGVLFLLGG